MMSNNDKIKLDDSVLEDVDSNIDKNELKNKNKVSKIDQEVSMDDLFDFKPIGVVGDEDSYMKSVTEIKTSKSQQTKKQKLENILDSNDDTVSFIDESIQNKSVNQNIEKSYHDSKNNNSNKSEMRNSIFKEEVVLYDEEKDKQFHSQNVTNINNDYDTYDAKKLRSLIESALYVCGNEGLSISDLKRLTNAQSSDIKKILKDWTNELDNDPTRGITIKIYGEKYKIFSKAENREDLSKLITIKYRNPLSSKVMETLAIIAYNQPCTRAIIEDIRAKDPTATIQKLIELGLVAEAGRADTPGRPLLYTVTHKFYDIFGIKNLSELPKINIDQPFDADDVSFFDTTRFND